MGCAAELEGTESLWSARAGLSEEVLSGLRPACQDSRQGRWSREECAGHREACAAGAVCPGDLGMRSVMSHLQGLGLCSGRRGRVERL